MRMFTTPLVSARWLHERLGTGRVRVLDCTMILDRSDPAVLPYTVRKGLEGCEAKRVPRATYFDLERASLGRDATGRDTYGNQINFQFDRDAFFDVLETEHGVAAGDHLVLYSHTAPMWATRVFWMCYSAGFPGEVSVLDGGLHAWESAGYPTDSGALPPSPPTSSLSDEKLAAAATTTPPYDPFVGRDHVQSGMPDFASWCDGTACGGAGRVLVHALPSVDGFAGKDGSYGRPGRIANAVHLPFTAFLNEDKTFKTTEEVAAVFAAAGLAEEPAAMCVYCGCGISATIPLFAALVRMGWRCPLQLYDGSLQEWCADAAAPMEVGGPITA